MAEITAQLVKELRDKTGAGMMDCKKALTDAGGDIEKAIVELRKKGLKNVGKRAERVAAEGVVYSYIHAGGRIGVMLELNCETDFVARGEDFQQLCKDISMHIAWSSPKYVSREEVPEPVVEQEKEIFRSQLKPEQQKVADKILAGRIEKFFQEICLLDQPEEKESAGKKRIGDIINDVSAKIGEKIAVRRFTRYEVGEGIEKPVTDYAGEVQAAIGS